MQKWEYLELWWYKGERRINQEERKDLKNMRIGALLDWLGEQGWELVLGHTLTNEYIEPSQFYFKRPKA